MDLKIILQDYDYFVYDGLEIVVFDNRKSKNPKHNELLMFGRIVRELDKCEIVPILDENYKEISQYYINLKKAFLRGVKRA